MLKFFQKLGKALMLPVCVLPVCGILMGIGYALCPNALQGGEITGTLRMIGFLLVKAGSAAIDNMSVLFVIGVAVGMADDGNGTAALAGIVSWFVITTLLSTKVMTVVIPGMTTDAPAYLAFSKIQNPTIGMLAGLIGAGCYNRFKDTRLPDFLAFFSGKRSVSIVTVLVSLAAALVLALIWPVCYGLMVDFGIWIVTLGGAGCGIYAFLNRLLIPTGMHHAINNVFWFDTIGIGDLTKFWAGMTSKEAGWSLGMYMSGFFPCMIGGIPGAALAIYHCADNKKKAMGVLVSTAVCAVLCGLTEPFEFSFMFQCFPLYIVYSLLVGLFSVITYVSGFRAGFTFSAGVIDLVCSSNLPAAQNTWMIIPLSLLAFALFYLAFRFTIKKFNMATIGRETAGDKQKAGGDSVSGKEEAAADIISSLPESEREMAEARGILKAVGGKNNVVSADCCATRLRLELKDTSLVKDDLAVSCGALGVVKTSGTSCQVIIGPTVQQMLDAFRKAMEEEPAGDAAAGKAVPAGFTEPTGPVVPHGERIRIRLQKEPEEPAVTGPAVRAETQQIPSIPVQTGEDGSLSFIYVIRDPSGIHARPAGQLAQIAKECGAEVTVEANGKTAPASSPVRLMELGVAQNTEIKVTVRGEPEVSAAAAAKLGSFLIEHL